MTSIRDARRSVTTGPNGANGSDELEQLRAEVAMWRSRYAAGELRPIAFANSVADVEPLYTPLDGTPDLESLGVPGSYPYTRGIHATGYRGRLWTMRQFAGFGSAQDTNARYK